MAFNRIGGSSPASRALVRGEDCCSDGRNNVSVDLLFLLASRDHRSETDMAVMAYLGRLC